MKRAAMLAMVAAAIAALVLPAAASAIWQHGQKDLAVNQVIQLTGQFGIRSGGLGKECLFDSKATLLGNSTTASVTQFEPDLTEPGTVTEKCFVTAGLEALGCVDVHGMTPENLPWTAHSVGQKTIAVTFGGAQTHVSGGIFCPKTTQVTPGIIHLTTAQNPYHTGQFSGILTTHNPSLHVEVTGEVTVTPASTYGGK